MSHAARLGQVGLFRSVTPAHLDAIASRLRVRHLDPGDVIFRSGDPGTSLLIVESGRVDIVIERGNTEVTLATLGPGESFGELALLDGLPRSATARAAVATELLVLGRPEFQAVLTEAPDVSNALLAALATMVRGANERISDIAFLGQHVRMAKALLALAERQGEPTPDGGLALGMVAAAELASLTGLHATTVERLLEDYQYEHILVAELGSLTIARPEVLRTWIRDLGQA